jgi:hypothetical protein
MAVIEGEQMKRPERNNSRGIITALCTADNMMACYFRDMKKS